MGARERDARSSRRGGAELLFMLVLACACAGRLAEFRPYRACVEKPGTMRHDPGEVLGEYLGDDYRRHYQFLPDRLRADRRQVVDVTRVNRICPLVSGISRDGHPVGDRWDLSERTPPP